MCGALDQAGARVEKLVGVPFQCDPAMGAAVLVDIDPTFAAHGKQPLSIDLEPAAAGIDQLGTGAKKLHDCPLVPKARASGGYAVGEYWLANVSVLDVQMLTIIKCRLRPW
ncbi:hypothetical protein D3C71_1828450 [compost metagenome]